MSRMLALLVATAVFLVPTGSPANATPDHYTPRPGPTFNSPLGNVATKRAIFRKIIRSINSSPRGSEINAFTWNFLTREGTNALLRAQSRGVRVRLLMSQGNNTEIVNQPFRRLRARFQAMPAEAERERRHGPRPGEPGGWLGHARTRTMRCVSSFPFIVPPR